MMKCKICGSRSESFAHATIRGKYQIEYFACSSCRFIQTEEPYWLKEAYAEPINRSDIGYIDRNIYLAKMTKALILFFFRSEAKFVDYGGGYGMLVRLMRDKGFNFRRKDKYCPNLFAPDFEAESAGQGEYELLTAFEVFEHLANPMEEIGQMLSYSKNIFFTTELAPCFKPAISQWNYFAPDHGQHVSFYSLMTLQEIAHRFNLKLYSDGHLVHLLTPRSLSPVLFKLAVWRKFATVFNRLARRPSLAQSDYQFITRQIR